MEAVREHAQGPYSSIILPTIAANGYWPIIPLGTVQNGECSGKLKNLTEVQWWLTVAV